MYAAPLHTGLRPPRGLLLMGFPYRRRPGEPPRYGVADHSTGEPAQFCDGMLDRVTLPKAGPDRRTQLEPCVCGKTIALYLERSWRCPRCGREREGV
jgi:hypothetical protein